MSQRNYNHIYTAGRFILQILQQSQHDRIEIDLLPQITVASNHQLAFGFGLSWIAGTVNFGIMTQEFTEGERKRRQQVIELAAKQGLTPRQYALRWGW